MVFQITLEMMFDFEALILIVLKILLDFDLFLISLHLVLFCLLSFMFLCLGSFESFLVFNNIGLEHLLHLRIQLMLSCELLGQ